MSFKQELAAAVISSLLKTAVLCWIWGTLQPQFDLPDISFLDALLMRAGLNTLRPWEWSDRTKVTSS